MYNTRPVMIHDDKIAAIIIIMRITRPRCESIARASPCRLAVPSRTTLPPLGNNGAWIDPISRPDIISRHAVPQSQHLRRAEYNNPHQPQTGPRVMSDVQYSGQCVVGDGAQRGVRTIHDHDITSYTRQPPSVPTHYRMCHASVSYRTVERWIGIVQ